jgi:hypothetical protein
MLTLPAPSQLHAQTVAIDSALRGQRHSRHDITRVEGRSRTASLRATRSRVLDLRTRAITEKKYGRHTRALQLYEQMLSVSERAGDSASMGMALTDLGEMHRIMGRNAEALSVSMRAAPLVERHGSNRTRILLPRVAGKSVREPRQKGGGNVTCCWPGCASPSRKATWWRSPISI